MALAFSLAALPVKFIAIPVLAGLAAGTGAVAAYVSAPAPVPTTMAALPGIPTSSATTEHSAPAKPATKPTCERETWPYIDNRCLTQRGNEPARQMRVVMAPRQGDVAPNAASPALVSSDTVLRGPGVAPEASEQPAVKKPSKRSERRQREESRRAQRIYSVPSARGMQPVIVVHPLPQNSYSSRF